MTSVMIGFRVHVYILLVRVGGTYQSRAILYRAWVHRTHKRALAQHSYALKQVALELQGQTEDMGMCTCVFGRGGGGGGGGGGATRSI